MYEKGVGEWRPFWQIAQKPNFVKNYVLDPFPPVFLKPKSCTHNYEAIGLKFRYFE